MRHFKTTKPGSQFIQHFTLVEEILTNPPTMSAGRIDMKNWRDVVLIQSQIIINSISRWNHLVVVTVNDEGTWCIFRHLFLIGIFRFQFGRSIFSQKIVVRTHVGIRFIHRNHRIEQNLEIRTKFGFGVSGNGRCQMSTGRWAHDTDIIGIQIPDISTVTYDFHCCFSIRNG